MTDAVTGPAAEGGGAAVGQAAAETGEALLELAWDLRAQLAWMEDLGVRELPLPPRPETASGRAPGMAVPTGMRAAPADMPQGERSGSAARSLRPSSERLSAAAAGPVSVSPVRREGPLAGRASSDAVPEENIVAVGDFVGLTEAVRTCSRCSLAGTRRGFLAGNGVDRSDLLLVGERVASLPDGSFALFEPPVTALLEKMVRAMGLSLREVACVDAVQCACGGALPFDAPLACRPLLLSAVRFVRPKVIISLGKMATQALLNVSEPITRLRGTWRQCAGIPVMPTYHPAYLLMHGDAKRQAWEDLQQVMKVLSGAAPGTGV